MDSLLLKRQSYWIHYYLQGSHIGFIITYKATNWIHYYLQGSIGLIITYKAAILDPLLLTRQYWTHYYLQGIEFIISSYKAAISNLLLLYKAAILDSLHTSFKAAIFNSLLLMTRQLYWIHYYLQSSHIGFIITFKAAILDLLYIRQT